MQVFIGYSIAKPYNVDVGLSGLVYNSKHE